MSTAPAQPVTAPVDTDPQLMAAYIAGDQRAFCALFDHYAELLRRYFQRHGNASTDVADLVQQTFLRLQLRQGDDSFRSGGFGVHGHDQPPPPCTPSSL